VTRIRAADRLQDALERSHRYPPGFGGFAAEIVVATDGGAWEGHVELASPRDVRLDLDAPEAATAFARGELASIAGHRWGGADGTADAPSMPVAEGEDAVTGLRVRLDGDPLDSSYRLRDGHVAAVERRLGEARFTIVVQDRTATADGRSIPTAFTVAWWDVASGRLTRADAYTDLYVDVDGVPLPALRRIVRADDDGVHGRELRLSGHRLLVAVAS
jgi:hypothetical protein